MYEKCVYDLYTFVYIYIYEILIAKLRLTLKKVAKTTKPFRYDLNQTLYDNTVEVKNKIQGLRFDRHSLKNYGRRFITLHRSQWSKPSRKGKIKITKSKMAVWRSLTDSWERKRSETQRKKERKAHLNAEFQRTAMRNKKAFLVNNAKK